VKESKNHSRPKEIHFVVVIMVVEVEKTLVEEVVEITTKGER
jgi:hypothetical protein